MKKYLLIRCMALGLAALWAFGSAYAQATLSVTWPKNGAVFQRAPNGKGNFSMLGSFNSASFRNARYRLTTRIYPLNVKTGQRLSNTPTRSVLVQRLNGGFIFSDFGSTDAGWYELTVTAEPINRNSESPGESIEATVKVGVGEVFIIGGQSNAQGLNNTSVSRKVAEFTGPLDGVRVQADFLPSEAGVAASNLYDVRGGVGDYANIPDLTSVSDNPNAGIGPSGPSLWLWARLGEQLVNNLGVPIAFYNAAWGGTTITEWARSTNPNKRVAGGTRADDNDPGNVFPAPEQPYSLLKKTVRLYGSLYGARAILWQQGETDTKALNSSTDNWGYVTLNNWDGLPDRYLRRVENSTQYRDRLKQVIMQTWNDFPGSPIPWMVATASYNENIISSIVTGGQTGLGLTNVFDGPVMDNIVGTTKRRQTTDVVTDDNFGMEPTHFKFDGLNDAADAWYTRIVTSGILNATPIHSDQSNPAARSLSLSSDGNSVMAPTGSTYQWLVETNNSANANISVSNQSSIPANPSGVTGFRRALVQDSQGRYTITQAVSMPYNEVDDTGTPPTTCATPASGSCYTIKVQKTNLFLQTVNGGATIQQLPANSQPNQLWKIEDTGNSRYRFIIQDGTNRVVQTTTGTTGNYLALGNYTGDDKQQIGRAHV